MKLVWSSILCIVIVACQGNTQEQVDIKTQKDTVSYSIGLDIGKNLKTQSIDVNPAVLAAGIKDAVEGGKTKLTQQQTDEAMVRFRTELVGKQQEKAKILGEKNLKDGEAFLAENLKKPGVKSTASGLQYKIIKQGSGAKPTATQTVTFNHRGTLIDGTEFDNSYKRGQPLSYPLNHVIKGWTEGLQLMSPGSKFEFYIPGNLAYGESPPGPEIPPNSTLIFEVELLSFK